MKGCVTCDEKRTMKAKRIVFAYPDMTKKKEIAWEEGFFKHVKKTAMVDAELEWEEVIQAALDFMSSLSPAQIISVTENQYSPVFVGQGKYEHTIVIYYWEENPEKSL